jgi:aarF domain-containing kinase
MPRWKQYVEIPYPYQNLCSKHILVMDYLDGVKLVDGIRDNMSKMAVLQGRSLQDLETEMKEKLRLGTMTFKSLEESKSSNQNIALMLTMSDIFKYNAVRFCYNMSLLRVFYGPWKYQWTEKPLDLGKYLETLSHVHAYELFTCGAFNGDCHPGNILLLKDGRLGLIDYGQVKTMTKDQRIKYAKLILAHARGDKQEIIRMHFDELKVKTKYRNPDVGYLMSCFYNDRDTPDILQGMNISSFIDWAQKKDPVIELPEDYILASRMSLLLRGMGKAFGLKIRMSLLWQHEAKEFLKSVNVSY